MSHGDTSRYYSGFTPSPLEEYPYAAIEEPNEESMDFSSIQRWFIPEGLDLIKNFLFHVCGCSNLWTMESFWSKLAVP